MAFAIISVLSAILIAAADQGTKYLASSRLTAGDPVNLLSAGDTEILTFSLYKNTGAAFSSLQGQTALLITVTVAMMAALVVWLARSKEKNKFSAVCVVMIVGGGIGNLIDRIFLGYVVDFIILFPFNFIFNFADICVVIGAILLLIYCLFFDKSDEPKAEAAEAENE